MPVPAVPAASADLLALPPHQPLRARFRAIRVIHPFPTLLNVAATAGLAFVASDGWPPVSVLLRMLAVMFLAQGSIGAANDFADRSLDARTKPWKPIAAGLVSPRAALALAAVCGVASLGLGATLGIWSFALAAVGLACGLSYDFGLKRTLFSPVPFMIAIPTLPAWVWVTLDQWEPVLWWLLPLGALIGLSVHLANTAPDIESDAANGVVGFAHRLGERRSLLAAWASFALALALSGILALFIDYNVPVYIATAAVGWTCAAVALFFIARRDDIALRAGFAAVGIGSAAVAVGWLAAVT